MGHLDIIGDVHSCIEELKELFEKLGYIKSGDLYIPPPGRTAICVGDIFARGPYTVETYKLISEMIKRDYMKSVMGNHEDKLMRYFKGNKVQLLNGDDVAVEDFNKAGTDGQEIFDLLKSFPYFLRFNNLIIVHASWRNKMIELGPYNKANRTLSIYGPVDGNLINGFPNRQDWVKDRYIDENIIVYGHQPYNKIRIENNTYGIDTGCVFGGKLTCLSWPEMKITQVDAREKYCNKGMEIATT
jgi:protein phosphatase